MPCNVCEGVKHSYLKCIPETLEVHVASRLGWHAHVKFAFGKSVNLDVALCRQAGAKQADATGHHEH